MRMIALPLNQSGQIDPLGQLGYAPVAQGGGREGQRMDGPLRLLRQRLVGLIGLLILLQISGLLLLSFFALDLTGAVGPEEAVPRHRAGEGGGASGFIRGGKADGRAVRQQVRGWIDLGGHFIFIANGGWGRL